jgi:hypothetical protein
MAAVIDLRTVSALPDTTDRSVGRAPSPSRPRLRVLDGGRSEAARRRQRVYWFRRALVAATLVAALLALGALAGAIGAATGGSTATVPVSDATHVVRQGDTLWSIATAARPGTDPRDVVADLIAANAGLPGVAQGELRVGQELRLPA